MPLSSSGDVNGDGNDDILIGAIAVDPGGKSSAGQSYGVFGKASGFGASIELTTLNGTNGFAVNGADPEDGSGRSVSYAGDINGDGFYDLVIGAPRADPNGINTGATYIIFGDNFTNAVDILGTDGIDNLVGTGAGEIIIAKQGNDTIIGNGGDDPMTGALGNDLFIFGNGDGDNTVVDFVTGAVSDDVVIVLDADDSVTLLDVELSNLHADDFLF